jgi:hypothetical protein
MIEEYNIINKMLKVNEVFTSIEAVQDQLEDEKSD